MSSVAPEGGESKIAVHELEELRYGESEETAMERRKKKQSSLTSGRNLFRTKKEQDSWERGPRTQATMRGTKCSLEEVSSYPSTQLFRKER